MAEVQTTDRRLAEMGYEVEYAGNGMRMLRKANFVLQNATDEEAERLASGRVGIDQLLQERETQANISER